MTLKSKALPLVVSIALLNSLILVSIESFGDLQSLTEFAWTDVATLTVFSAGALVLVNIVPTSLAERLIFLRLKYYLPGNRVPQIIEQDNRLDLLEIMKTWPELESITPGQSNAWWYQKVYKPVRDDPGVASAHFSYLFLRDAFSATLVIGIGGLVWRFALGELDSFRPPSSLAIGVVFSVAILLAISARNSGRRMVANSFGAHL